MQQKRGKTEGEFNSTECDSGSRPRLTGEEAVKILDVVRQGERYPDA